MPRGRKLWYKKSQTVYTPPRQQYCVVCYNSFHLYPVAQNKWESCMTKVFYKAMNIPPFQTGGDEDGDEDDVLLSLPYCPECHSKISVMFNLYTQLEALQNQYACIRNEIAFIVVETIDRNSSKGPMDFIRQQIFEKWQEFYAEESTKSDFRDAIGLDALIAGNPFDLQEMFADTLDMKEEPGEYIKENQTVDEEFHPVSAMMELEFKENTVEPHNKVHDSDELALAPNAVHVVPKGMSENQRDEGLMNTSYDQPVDTPRKRGRPRGSVNASRMPRLIPMGGGKRKKGGGTSILRGLKRGKFQRAGRGGRAFAHHAEDEVMPDHDGADETHSDSFTAEHDEFEEGSANEEDEPVPTNSKRGPPKLTSKPFESENEYDQTNHVELKPEMRYPKRSSGRSLRSDVKQEPMETFEEMNETFEENSLGDENLGKDHSLSGPGIYPCRLCPKFYTNASRLLRHESLCHPSLKSFQCETCGKGFSSRLTYRRHRANAHPDATEGAVKCSVCGKTFLRNYSLEIHMKTHRVRAKPIRRTRATTEGNGYTRIENGESSNLSAASTPQKNLSSPEKSRSEPAADTSDDSLTCGICQKTFPYRTLLTVHFLTHAKKNVKCDTCNAVFTNYADLKVHSDEAHRGKPLKCSVCGDGFNAVEQLQRHMKVHDLKQEIPDQIEPESQNESFDDQPLFGSQE